MIDEKLQKVKNVDEELTAKAAPVDRSTVESFKLLRTNILYTENTHVIVVTSTIRDEGKTVTAFQLARSFSSMGKNTLLIDCDLRRPSLKKYMLIRGHTVGLSESLSGQSKDVVYRTNVENLSVILSGKVPPNPSELLSGEKFGLLISKMRERFDYIIIDTPPVSSCPDASIVGRIGDGVLLVVRNDFVKQSAVKRAKDQIDRNGGHVLGVVLNRIKKYQKDYYGEYGYYE